MNVEIIQDQPDLQRMREVDIHQSTHLVGKVDFGAVVGDADMSPSLTGAEGDE